MQRNLAATVGVVALLAVPATASADSVIVKYKSGAAAKSKIRGRGSRRVVEGARRGRGHGRPGGRSRRRRGRRGRAQPVLDRRVRGAEPRAEGVRRAQRRALRRALRAQQRQRRRHGRARGLGPRRHSAASRRPAGPRSGIVDTGIDDSARGPGGQDRRLRRGAAADRTAVREGSCTDDNDHGTHVAGTIAAKANNGVGVAGVSFNSQLAICKALNAVGCGHDRRRRELHHLPREQGREDHLDVARRRRLDHAAERGRNALHQRHGVADHRRGRQRRRRDAQLPGRATPRSSPWPRPTATTARASFSNANADVEIAARRRRTCSRPSAAAATSRSRAPRWPRRTSPASRR